MLHNMWNLCRVNCPALPYDAKLEAKHNSLNWNGQPNGIAKEGMDFANGNPKKDHLVIATQPRNHVINKALAPSSSHFYPESSAFNPIANLLTSDFRSFVPGSVATTANSFLNHSSSSINCFRAGFGCRKKQHPVYNRSAKAEIGDVNGFGLRSKSEERQPDHFGNRLPPLTTANGQHSSLSNHLKPHLTSSNHNLSLHRLAQPTSIGGQTCDPIKPAEPFRLPNSLYPSKSFRDPPKKTMDVSEMSTSINESTSNSNSGPDKRGTNFSGCTEYRAAFNWPPGSQSSTTTINHQIVNGTEPSIATTSVSLVNGVKSQTIADFSELSAIAPTAPPIIAAAITNPQLVTPTNQQQLNLAPGPAGLPSYNHPAVAGDRIKDRPQVLFARATPSPPVVEPKPGKPITKTEYKKKFKPFSTYVYIPGSGWKKSKKVDKETGAEVSSMGAVSSSAAGANSEGALEWYDEVVERAKKACEFRSRSQFGHPIVGVDHLESIYRETSSNLWNQPRDRSIAALALATSNHLRVSTRTTRGSSRDSSRDSSKAGSDRITSHALISPSKETPRKPLADKPKTKPKSNPQANLTSAAAASPKSTAIAASASRIKPSPAPKSKPLADNKKRSGGASTPGGAKPVSVDSEGGKIWLKPRREDKKPSSSTSNEGSVVTNVLDENKEEGDNPEIPMKLESIGDGENCDVTQTTTGASSLATSGSLTPLLSPRDKEGGRKEDDELASNATNKSSTASVEDQSRSPRPNSLVSSLTNGSDLTSPPALPDGPVKTTEIKSPEEVTGVKSPSPELWRVSIDTGADINWTEAKPVNIPNPVSETNNKILTNNNNIDFTSSDNDLSHQTNDLKQSIYQSTGDSKLIQLPPESQQPSECHETTANVTSSETNAADPYGPLSI